VKAEAALDEGNPLVEGIVPSISVPVAPIGIAEKGYLTVTLSVDIPGGHSSTPNADSAIGALSQAALRLQTHPLEAHFDGATARFFEWAGPEMSIGQRMVLGNTWLTSPLVRRLFASTPTLDASIRTTTAVTVFRSGVKDNVIPRAAEAQVNFRVLPGDTTDGVLAHVRSVIDDERVRIEPQNATRREPPPISRTEGPTWSALASTVREVFPGAVVAPALFLGATDGRQYARVAKDVYRFLPVKMTSTDVGRIHATDERIATRSLVDAVRFYRRLIDVLAR
jgi:carboxypeptidase PM20D1